MSVLGGVSACVQDLTDPTRRLYFENLTRVALLRRKLLLLFLPYVSYRFVLLTVTFRFTFDFGRSSQKCRHKRFPGALHGGRELHLV